jgi:poly(3-hydroxybutyrate) depolymerase
MPAIADQASAGTTARSEAKTADSAGRATSIAGEAIAGSGGVGQQPSAGISSPALAGRTAAAGGGGGGVCGPGLKAGRSDELVMVGPFPRSFVYYAPADLDPNVPVPVVIAAHGFTMSGDMMFNITGYTELADREKFVVLFPDGDPDSLGPWNVGDGICGLGAFVAGLGSDQDFIDQMLAFVEQDRCIDRSHLYITGFSMGGYFANETGCLRSEFRAIAPHSGGSHDLTLCPTQHKPVIIHHFVDDALIGYDCGVEARDRWVQRNGCSPFAPEVETVKGGQCEYYRDCPADGQVAFCSYQVPPEGGGELILGHAWSGGAQNVPSGGSFAIPGTESAAELTWKFWKKYAW